MNLGRFKTTKEIELNCIKKRIRNDMQYIVEMLQVEISNIDSKEDYKPNDLGVMQSLGARLDNEIGKYCEKKKFIEELPSMNKRLYQCFSDDYYLEFQEFCYNEASFFLIAKDRYNVDLENDDNYSFNVLEFEL